MAVKRLERVELTDKEEMAVLIIVFVFMICLLTAIIGGWAYFFYSISESEANKYKIEIKKIVDTPNQTTETLYQKLNYLYYDAEALDKLEEAEVLKQKAQKGN